jgi:hypothetical protein
MPTAHEIKLMAEETFYKLVREDGGLLHRLPDTYDLRKSGGVGQIPKQPSDFVVMVPELKGVANGLLTSPGRLGKIYFAEVKGTDNKTAFNFDQLQVGQKQWITLCSQHYPEGYYIFIWALTIGEWFRIPANEVPRDFRQVKFEIFKQRGLTWNKRI